MTPMRTALATAFVIVGLLALTRAGTAAELIIMEQAGCSWCQRWHSEIGPVYPLTAEGRRAPLRPLDIDGDWPKELTHVARDHFTPTFVLMNEGIEIGRLRGYPGDEFFWFLLNELLAKLPPASTGS